MYMKVRVIVESESSKYKFHIFSASWLTTTAIDCVVETNLASYTCTI